MKYLMILFFMADAEAMTVAQAKAKIAEVSQKRTRTVKDIADFKEAIAVLSGTWTQPQE